ncbi:MAG: hypothetical protein ACKVZH_14285 [Blastocatellia bacterium]
MSRFTQTIKGFLIVAMTASAITIWSYTHYSAAAYQQRPAQPPQTASPSQGLSVQPLGEEALPEAQRRALSANPKITEAAELLAAQGEELDFSKARTIKQPPPAPNERRRIIIIIIIDIKTNARVAASRKPEYAKLVYQKTDDGQELVYFDEPTGSKPAAQDSAENARLGCGPWSGWQETGRNCRTLTFRCPLNNQQAWFVSYRRERSCPRRTQVQTKTVKLRCGC